MFLHLVFLVALLNFGQSQNQCVREIRLLKNDLQVELRDVVTDAITDSSVSREDVQELVEDKATKEDVQALNHSVAAGNQLTMDTLAANQNATIEGLDQLVRDKATKEDFQSLKSGNQLMMDTLLASVANQNITRDELVGLVSDKATNICQAVNSLNFSVATGNEHIMETLLQIIASQNGIRNATTLNSGPTADQCVTRDEVRDVIRTEVESVIRTEVQSIIQAEIQSLTRLVAEIQNNTDRLLQQTLTYTCNGTPGWRRVTFMNMTDTSYNCPPGLKLTSYSKRTCGRAHTGRYGCSSTTFNVGGSEYSRVCGRIKGYQVGSTLSFNAYVQGSQSINSYYVDGVSLTHGPDGGRQHIWTFAAGLTEENYSSQPYLCPCDISTLDSPPFVSDNYFCESGANRNWDGFHREFFPDDPLWDGEGCSSTSTCCQLNNPPWFTKNLPNPTTDDIELRLCLDNRSPYSDVPLQIIELYIQ